MDIQENQRRQPLTSRDRKRKKDKDPTRVKEERPKQRSTKSSGSSRGRLNAVDEAAAAAAAATDDSGATRLEDGCRSSVGLTQEKILQLRAMDGNDEDDGGEYAMSGAMTSFFGGHSAESMATKLYVENEISGEFFRVRQRPRKSVGLISKASLRRRLRHRPRHHDDSDGNDDDDMDDLDCCSASTFQRWTRDIEAALVVLCHGVVVGLSWMDAFNLGVTEDQFLSDTARRQAFACTYSSVADRSRQLFFLMFKYPFQRKINHRMMRKISRLRLQQDVDQSDESLRRFRVKSLRLMIGAVGLTVIALLVLLIASPTALLLSTTYAANPNWCDGFAAGVESSSSKALRRFQQSSITNAVFLSIAWLLVCIQCNMGMAAHLSVRRQLIDLHKSMDHLEQRLEQLEGKHLDNISIEELKDLIQSHKRAIDATESVLVSKLQIRNPGILKAVQWEQRS